MIAIILASPGKGTAANATLIFRIVNRRRRT
jgi:hypothetical protein